jgi:hypothetical protein
MGLLNKDFFSQEELNDSVIRYEQLIYWFNKINDENQGKVDQYSYVDYHKLSKEIFRVDEWVEFLSDYRVTAIMDKIMLINMRANANKLLTSEEKSVAASQKLNMTLAFLGKYFDSNMNKETTRFIYTSVPLTEKEKQSRDAKVMVIKPTVNPTNPAILGNNNQTTKSMKG